MNEYFSRLSSPCIPGLFFSKNMQFCFRFFPKEAFFAPGVLSLVLQCFLSRQFTKAEFGTAYLHTILTTTTI